MLGLRVWFDVLYSDFEFFYNLEKIILLNTVSLLLTVGRWSNEVQKSLDCCRVG